MANGKKPNRAIPFLNTARMFRGVTAETKKNASPIGGEAFFVVYLDLEVHAT